MHDVAITRFEEELVADLRDGLRTFVTITPDDFTVHYLSDELSRRYDEASFDAVLDEFRIDPSFLSADGGDYPIGDRRAIIYYHEHAFVLQIPAGGSRSHLISVTPDVGRDLMRFVERCREQLGENEE